jgi:CheY-like chemotaxis protein
MEGGKRMKILIVDDNPIQRKLAERLLARFGECVGADGAKQALGEIEVARQMGQGIDLIVLDYQMPGGSGAEFCRWLNTWSQALKIKAPRTLALTYVDDVNAQEDLKNSGCDGFMHKPLKGPILEEYLGTLGIHPIAG